VQTHTNTAQDTEDFGWQLASARRDRDTALAVLYLSGELGSGKTTFARGFLRALGVTVPVRSPTYTLLELYPVGTVTLLHVDLYRVREPAEVEALGLREWARDGCVWLIEWPERSPGRLPPADLELQFAAGVAGHDIHVASRTALGASWLVQLTGENRHGAG
jgi:tRNA threonylcarbamoyladenosine biosynthesis protein TsaE